MEHHVSTVTIHEELMRIEESSMAPVIWELADVLIQDGAMSRITSVQFLVSQRLRMANPNLN
jgi:hypothetical protein